jgi:BirA family biotin operon repressor/biotin-[acetyl-CoA-carboxylase] ligase
MISFDDNRFKEQLDTDLFGQNFIHLAETGSTNDYGASLIEKKGSSKPGDIDGTLILADMQSSGRGRFNRDWASPSGGLWFTLIFKTGLPLEKVPAITLLAAYSAADTLIADYGIDVTIKWPNDLYQDGFKFGGILSEEKLAGDSRFIILGMGLNIDIDKDYLESLENKATNIQDLTKENVLTETLLANIMKRFEDLYTYYEKTGDLDSIFKEIEKILRY